MEPLTLHLVEAVMRLNKTLFLGCTAFALLAVMPAIGPALAQSAEVTGYTVDRAEVSFGNDTGSFVRNADGQWVQLSAKGQVLFRFEEAGRDATSLFLFDRSRNFRMQLDLGDSTLSFRDAANQKAVFATITSAYAAAPSGGSNRAPSQTTSSATQTKQPTPNQQDDANFNPFADDTAPGNAATTTPSQTTRNPRDAINAAGGRPAFTQTGGAGGGAGGGGTTSTAKASALSFDGPWVADGEIATETGDGIATGVTWRFPEAIWIQTEADGSLTIDFDAVPPAAPTSVSLSKTADNQYAGSGYTAQFTPITAKNIRLLLTGGGRRRDFSISKVPSGAKLSRSRIKPDSDEEIDTFTAGNLVPRYNDMFLSYRAEKMDLFNAGKGQGLPIFKAPSTTDFSIERNLQSKTVPYGVRGKEIRRTEGNQLESVITNASSFEKSMSVNYGVSGSFRGVSAGAEATREQSRGSNQSAGTTKAFGLARAEIYVLFLDKPNAILEPDFKYDILELAKGSITAEQFRIKYGTHYANAIHFGGIGKAERTVTTRDFKEWAKESTSVKVNGGMDAGPAASVKANGGLTLASGSSQGGTSMFSNEKWSSVGGSGSMTPNGWSVDERNSVPVRYDLKPLSELISPIFFGEEWSTPLRSGLIQARAMLDNEITRYLRSQPKAEDRSTGPLVYQLTFHSIQCVNNGDDGKAPAELYGKLKAVVRSLDGEEAIQLIDASEDLMKTVSCDGGEELPIDKTALVVASRDASAEQGSFHLYAEGLKENDPTALLIDDPINVLPLGMTMIGNLPIPEFGKWVKFKDWNASTPRTDIPGTQVSNIGNATEGPDLRVRVSFKLIQ